MYLVRLLLFKADLLPAHRYPLSFATGEGLAFHLALVALISGSVLCVTATASWILADFYDWRRSESCRALMAQADAAAAMPPDLEPSAPVHDARAENDGLRQRQVLND